LFLHILSLLVGIGAAPVMWLCLFRLRAAQTAPEAGPWGALAGQLEKLFPVAILGLFATGAYMTSDVWAWDTGWIDVGIVALVVLGLSGAVIAGGRAHKLKAALMANGPGPLSETARKLTRDPALWIVSFGNPGLVLGIVWNMTQKPGTLEAVIAAVIGFAVGAAIALQFTKAPAAVVESSAPVAG
jgi:hypothetical protein